MLVLAIEHAHVRAEEFVRGADEKVAIERAHVDWAVRRVMHGIDVGHGSHPMRHANNLFYVVDGSHRIRGVANGYQLGAAGDFPRQVIHVQGAVLIMNLGHPDRDASFLESQPGRIVGAMIEPSDYDLIAGFSSRPIDRLMAKVSEVMFAPKTTSSGSQARKSAMATRAPASIASVRWLVAKAPSVLALLRPQIIRDCVDHALRNLRPAGAVEINDRMAVDGLRREGNWERTQPKSSESVLVPATEVVKGHEQLVPRSVIGLLWKEYRRT